jgi:hypothetical protein
MDWLSDDNRKGLSDGKDECTPANRNRAAAAIQSECACRHSSSDWQKRRGSTVKPGWSPRKGRRFRLLRNELVIRKQERCSEYSPPLALLKAFVHAHVKRGANFLRCSDRLQEPHFFVFGELHDFRVGMGSQVIEQS